MNFPSRIFSSAVKTGHIQGIAVDEEQGFVYHSYTTILLKTDLQGRPVGSVKNIIGHLGCITFDPEHRRLYGSLELKHDNIGRGITNLTGKELAEEDAFYLVSFEVDKITRMDMDAEADGIMTAMWLREPCEYYALEDEVSGKPHRYGCSGIDGVALGRPFGADKGAEKKIMVAAGIYRDNDTPHQDHQIIFEYSVRTLIKYARPLTQAAPHRSGPDSCENRYFLYTGNTTFGVQNLEYDEYLDAYIAAVYPGQKPEFENYTLFFIAADKAPEIRELCGRGGECGKLLSFKEIGESRDGKIYGSHFPHGACGIYSFGNGSYYFAIPSFDKESFTHSGELVMYKASPSEKQVFAKTELLGERI